MTAYYNENDPKAAEWLRMLILMGEIAEGDVDERSVEDVHPSDLKGYTQCHFFAGIGGWSYALRLAGRPDDKPVWTGSCPCQPFSAAGKGRGFADERHLWPAWFHLIRQCRPSRIFGEQVANALTWLDLVSTDLEAEGYATGAAIVGAHSVGAPHIQQRLYWVADAESSEGRLLLQPREPRQTSAESFGRGADGALANNNNNNERPHGTGSRDAGRREFADAGDMGNSSKPRSGRNAGAVLGEEGSARWRVRSELDKSQPSGAADGDVGHASGERLEGRSVSASGRANERSPWAASDLVWCRDGKWRPVEPGVKPLAHGVSGRVGLLRGYGNAIVPQVAAAFIEAYRSIVEVDA